jgi:hypothetical protein
VARKPTPTNATVLEVAYAKTRSYRKAARVAAFVVAWGVVRRELGRTPSVEEYAEYWKQSRATAFREQEAFREVFDRCDTPDLVLDRLEAAQRVSDPVAAIASLA